MKVNREIEIDDLEIINMWLKDFKEQELPKLVPTFGGWATHLDIDTNGDILKISTDIKSKSIFSGDPLGPVRKLETIGKLDDAKLPVLRALITLNYYFSHKL